MLSWLPTAPGNSSKVLFRMNKHGLQMGGKKVAGPLWLELEEFWGRSTAKKFFNEKGIILSAHFDSV
jgi:hypothetical protein